jgi:hypothetical protein
LYICTLIYKACCLPKSLQGITPGQSLIVLHALKPFFLFICAGLLSLYTLFFGTEFDISGPTSFSESIVIAFTASFLAAANISLFRKKAAAVIGLIAFLPVMLWAIVLMIKTTDALGLMHWAILFIFALLILIGCAIFYSTKSIFFTNELKWNTKSQVIYILRLILIGVQICILWVIFNQGKL